MAKKEFPQKLNICIVAREFPLLGRATDHGFLWPIARGLTQLGHSVTVLSWKNPQGKKEISQDGVKAYFLGEPFAVNVRKLPGLLFDKFVELHAKEPFHLVHSIDNSGRLIGQKRKELKVAMLYDVEATNMSKIFAILAMSKESATSMLSTALQVAYKFLITFWGRDRPLLKTADGMFVTSPQQKLALERHYLYPEYRTYSVPYGIEIGDLSPREKSEELRKKLGIPLSARIVVTTTDMTELEESRNLLRAFEKVVIKKPSSFLLVVGDGPLKKEIEFEMLSLALGKKVLFTGEVRNVDIPDYIALGDVYVNLSSRSSGFDASMLEAMAQKKLVIGSEFTPLSTIVEDGEEGFLIRPADISSLADLLLQAFTHRLPIQKIGERARKKVLEIFDTKMMVQQTIDAYQKTLANTGYYSQPKFPRLNKGVSEVSSPT
jgi:glycosyltransferase involved in cell wall biosynthesis